MSDDSFNSIVWIKARDGIIIFHMQVSDDTGYDLVMSPERAAELGRYLRRKAIDAGWKP